MAKAQVTNAANVQEAIAVAVTSDMAGPAKAEPQSLIPIPPEPAQAAESPEPSAALDSHWGRPISGSAPVLFSARFAPFPYRLASGTEFSSQNRLSCTPPPCGRTNKSARSLAFCLLRPIFSQAISKRRPSIQA